MNNWQPIETAPKGNESVLLYGVVAGEISGMSTRPSGPHIGFWMGGGSDFDGDDWWALDGGDYYETWCRATHWMPLPEPPE